MKTIERNLGYVEFGFESANEFRKFVELLCDNYDYEVVSELVIRVYGSLDELEGSEWFNNHICELLKEEMCM